jgi:hypothetical protein
LTARTSRAGYDREVVYSLAMVFEKTTDGRVAVIAPWMSEPHVAKTFEEAYWEALRQRSAPRRDLSAAAE